MSSDAVDHPLALFFDQTNKVLLATFSGVFTRQITIDLDTAARALAAHHGPFAVILDFTKVTELAIQLRDWPQFATNRRAIRGTRRIMVAPPTDMSCRCACMAPITAVPAKTPMWWRRGRRPIGIGIEVPGLRAGRAPLTRAARQEAADRPEGDPPHGQHEEGAAQQHHRQAQRHVAVGPVDRPALRTTARTRRRRQAGNCRASSRAHGARRAATVAPGRAASSNAADSTRG